MNGSHILKMKELTTDGEQPGQPSSSKSETLIAQVKNIICGNS
jgi:hypothetical protein